MTTDVVTGIVAGILGVCLLGIIGALIFNPKFRSDLAANPGRVSLFGASVEGVVIVLILVALIIAMVMCAQIISGIEYERIRAGKDELSIRITQLPSEVSKGSAEDTIAAIKDYVQKSKVPKITYDVVSEVKKLNYSDDPSKVIRGFPSGKIGPWSISGDTEEYLLSVPNNISEGEAYWCNDNIDRYYEIRSRLEDPISGTSTIIKITNPITVAATCSETQEFLQATCTVASRVFGSSVVTCDSKGQPEWRIQPNNKVPIWVTEVPPDVNAGAKFELDKSMQPTTVASAD